MTRAGTERTGESLVHRTAARGLRVGGFTLFELLLSLAIVLVLLAIALPFSMHLLEERELASTEEHIASGLIKARVHAQESGKPVEVVVLEGAPSHLTMRYFQADVGRSERRGSRGGASESSRLSDRPARPGSPSTKRSARDEWSEVSPIDSSVRVEGQDAVSDAGAGSDADDDAFGADEHSTRAEGEPFRLAVFLPDGSTLFAAALMLVHDSGLQSRLTVDPWTGQPAIARGARDEARDKPFATNEDGTGSATGPDRRVHSPDPFDDAFESDTE